MNKHLTTIVAVIATASAALAGSSTFDAKKTVIPVEQHCKFRDMEIQVDTFGTGGFYRGGNPGWGGGIGLNVFAFRYVGLGAEQMVVGNGNGTEWGTIGNLFLRYPVCKLDLAPCAMAGIGKLYGAGDSVGVGHVGGGIEYRLTDNVGLFADGRWLYSPQLENGGGVLARTGLRWAF